MAQTNPSRGPLLTGRRFIITSRDVAGCCTWYSPLEYLKDRYPSVVDVDHYAPTTFQPGNWFGYIIQHVGKRFFLILFSQENRHPADGFAVTTDDRWTLRGESLAGVKDAFKKILPTILSK